MTRRPHRPVRISPTWRSAAHFPPQCSLFESQAFLPGVVEMPVWLNALSFLNSVRVFFTVFYELLSAPIGTGFDRGYSGSVE